MDSTTWITYGILLAALLVYMGYLAWKEGTLSAYLAAPFMDGGTEGVAAGYLLIALMDWYILGWNTALMSTLVGFSVGWFFLGRRIEKKYSRELS